jgi:hypothetical protein
MRKKLGLIGVGSLGGFIADKLQTKVDTIYAVDPDIVEERNLRNSIYTKADINKPKVMALREKISHCKFIPIQSDIRKIELPNVDTIADCRDVTHRNIDTDVKFSVVGRHLRVDCSEINANIDRCGNYMLELEKPEVSRAGRLATRVFMSDSISLLQSNRLCVYISLDVQNVDKEICKLVRQIENPDTKINKTQLLYESLCEMFDVGGA